MYQPPQYTCPRCGAPIQAGQPTCTNCGLPLDPASIAAFQQSQQPGVRVSPPAPYPPGTVPRRRSSAPLIIGVIVGALVLGCGLLLVLGAIFSNTPAGQTLFAEETATAQAVAKAPQSTATPAPLPPSATPVIAPAKQAPAATSPPAAATSLPSTATPVPPATPTVLPPSATTVPPTPASSTIGQVGKPQVAGGVSLTVNKVSTATSIQDFLKPKAGNIYLVLDVTIATVGTDTAPYNPLYFKLKDADGFEYDSSLLAPSPDLKSGDLAQGQKVRGNVAFEVPKTAKGFIVSYEPLVIFGGFSPIQVDLGR